MSPILTPVAARVPSLPKISRLVVPQMHWAHAASPSRANYHGIGRLRRKTRGTNQGNAPIALAEVPARLGRVALDVAPYGRRIRIYDFHSLRQFLEVLEARRPRGIAAECLAD